jgi:hypothetical protein
MMKADQVIASILAGMVAIAALNTGMVAEIQNRLPNRPNSPQLRS